MSVAESSAPATKDTLGTGRRKTSVARVRIRPGNGKITINRRTLDEFFSEEKDRAAVIAPLVETETRDSLDVTVKVHGGGFSGQSGAIKLGVARALAKFNSELDEPLKHAGLMTRDSRMKERKKCGLRGARKGTQFSKR